MTTKSRRPLFCAHADVNGDASWCPCTTSPSLDVPLPPGFAAPYEWEPGCILYKDETRAWRLIRGADRKLTDNDGYLHLRATQYSDGSIDDLGISVFTADDDLNSDQVARAGLRAEAAAELDGLAR